MNRAPKGRAVAAALSGIAADGKIAASNPEEAAMAKGQQRQPKEKKKPKQQDKSKSMSSYKSAYSGGGSAPALGAKKPGP